MNLKTFEGPTMADALSKVKQYFGDEALILGTRTYTRSTSCISRLGRGDKQVVEITAAKDVFSLRGYVEGAPFLRSKDGGLNRERVADRRSCPMNKSDAGLSVPRPSQVAKDGALAEPTRRVEGVSKMSSADTKSTGRRDRLLTTESAQAGVRRLAPAALSVGEKLFSPPRDSDVPLSDELRRSYQELIEAQVAEDIAAELIQKVRATLPDEQMSDPSVVRACLAGFVESMLPVCKAEPPAVSLRPLVIALVGPTGTGKTTTVAKLAANYSLREGRKVGLITLDTYRIAAVEQMKTYARIIGVPLQVVSTAEQMRAALTTFRNCDAVLIDTAGTSPGDDDGLVRLKKLLDEGKPREVHLVLSSTDSVAVLNRTIQRFTPLGVNRVIFTKLDEAVGFGVILSCLHHAEAKLSYVTTGQNVPDHIQAGRSANLVDLILPQFA